MAFTPNLENPYPTVSWERLDNFQFLSNLRLLRMASRGVVNTP